MKNGELPSADWLKELLGLSSEFNKKFTNVVAVNRGAAPYVNSNGKRARSGTDPLEDDVKLVIVGDLHGQFRDLMAIFEEVTGMPSDDIVYIFNGDLVDRGDMSVEIMITVLLAQQVYREKVIILRGNHETAWMNNSYGFAAEVRRKYSDSMLTAFHQVFNTLPIAAVIDKEIFVTHGGLGPKSHKMTIAEINTLNRFCEPGPNTPIYELLWNGMTLLRLVLTF
jgi:predicted phosphodiesterase